MDDASRKRSFVGAFTVLEFRINKTTAHRALTKTLGRALNKRRGMPLLIAFVRVQLCFVKKRRRKKEESFLLVIMCLFDFFRHSG